MSELPCPLLTTFSIAERFLEAHASDHQQLDEARARIRLEREIAEAVHGVLPCTPAVNNDAGLIKCPLAHVCGDIWALAIARSDYGGSAAPLVAAQATGAML